MFQVQVLAGLSSEGAPCALATRPFEMLFSRRPGPLPSSSALTDASDADLLAEVHRRFGDSWCAFSAAVRPRGACAGCEATDELTRHHLVPVAEGGGQDRAVRARYVTLCRPCHALTHRMFGPGHAYDGPSDRELFVKALRERLRDGEP